MQSFLRPPDVVVNAPSVLPLVCALLLFRSCPPCALSLRYAPRPGLHSDRASPHPGDAVARNVSEQVVSGASHIVADSRLLEQGWGGVRACEYVGRTRVFSLGDKTGCRCPAAKVQLQVTDFDD